MVSRRTLLTGATVVGAGAVAAAAGGVAYAGAEQRRIPRTLAHQRGRVASRERNDVAEFTLTHLSVTAAAGAAVRLRDGSGWGEWLELACCQGGRDGLAASGNRSLVLAHGVTGYEVQTTDGSPAVVREINTIDGPAGMVAAVAKNALPLRGTQALALNRYLPRQAWGADESLRLNPDGTQKWPAEFFPVQTLTVHHTGVDAHNDDPDPAATVRAIYYDDTIADDFGDLGYHLLIDEAGAVYEGRWSGTDGVPVYGGTANADGRPKAVNGAHVGGFNAGNVGVSLLGRFTNRQPTAAARESLVRVLAGIAGLVNLDPLAQVNYVNPVSGAGGRVNTILGHRDWQAIGAGATECPGNAFHPTLAALRQEVAAELS
ncbi:peptidoglycan recognition protein family protein [Catenuloplanes atrovinosus]|uniref:Peptidoglycan recognition protein family domain-containing protein n=1 Tax=Catenuloplanes atrovinosus TaxID=137266 RepID=A0AAE3YJ24_9ACTN|nr:peptidoglycan recognition family protein [Catenuloplanes atrovinosus]MDR7273377.1 hypothetical protein [Catenuloplanes atrovinosus]